MTKRIKPYVPPGPAKIMIVSDCPSEQDMQFARPLKDYKGQEFARMFSEAGGKKADCYITTVMKERPPSGDIFNWCHKKAQASAISKSYKWPAYEYPQLSTGKYLDPIRCLELFTLREEIQRVRPNICIALGNTAFWALCHTTGIQKHRGTILDSILVPGVKVLPTYNPGAVIADWSKRVIVIADLMKAIRESEFPTIERPARSIHIAESIQDIEDYMNEFLIPSTHFMFDIETIARKFISCISFSAAPDSALVIPFIKYGPKYYKSTELEWIPITNGEPAHSKEVEVWRSAGPNRFSTYWPSIHEEKRAWRMVQKILALPHPKGGQNILYDTQYLLMHGIVPRNISMDTMILHHALHPELPKSLGFLGSIYSNEASWKEFRPKGKGTEYKREE